MQPAEDLQRVEAGRAPGAAACADAGQNARDQPVDVKQRHDVEAAIFRRQRERFADVGGGGAHVALPERHDLGARGGAGGVQHEGHIVGFWAAPGRSAAPEMSASSVNSPAGRSVGRDQLDDRDAAARGDVEDGRRVAALHEDGARFEVGEIEVELLRAVAGVERCGGGGGGDAGERGGHLGAVG